MGTTVIQCIMTLNTSMRMLLDSAKKHGGILWSREELKFIKKVQTMTRRLYWVGIRQVGLNWTYFSDNSSASESLFYKLESEDTLGQYIDTKGNTGPIDINHELYSVCEYTGETCEAKKSENKDCYEFTATPKNLTNAAKTCKLFGGRLAEYRDHNQLIHLRETIWRHTNFDAIPIEKIEVSLGSWLPTIWNSQHELVHEKSCEIYLMTMIQKVDCTRSYNFVCKFDAISDVNCADVYPNSSKPCTELYTQEATTDSMKALSKNMPQGISRQDTNYTVNVTYITVIIVGVIILIAIIITAIIQNIIMRKRELGDTINSNSNESINTVQSIDIQRRSLPEIPKRSSPYEEVDINVETRSFPAIHQEVSLQHHYIDVIET